MNKATATWSGNRNDTAQTIGLASSCRISRLGKDISLDGSTFSARSNFIYRWREEEWGGSPLLLSFSSFNLFLLYFFSLQPHSFSIHAADRSNWLECWLGRKSIEQKIKREKKESNSVGSSWLAGCFSIVCSNVTDHARPTENYILVLTRLFYWLIFISIVRR